MKKLILITLPLIFLALILFFYKENTSVKNVEYWAKNITLCQNKTLATEEEVFKFSYTCLKNSIRSSVYNESFFNWVKAAEPIMANDVRLEYVCHVPGHDLGKEFSDYFQNDYRRAIMSLGFDICGGGIVHGIFDVWGAESRDIKDFLDISQACLEQNLIRYSTCGDAIGHAAYESYGQSIELAIEVCDKLQQNWIRNTCANGVFMQRYFPQSSKNKLTRNEPVPEWDKLIELCNKIIYTQPGTSNGCYSGAGWVIGNDIYFKSQKYNRSGNDLIATEEGIAIAIKMITKAQSACLVGFAEGSNKSFPSYCINLMISRMPLFWYGDKDKFIENCEKANRVLLPIEGYDFLTNCLAGGFEHINKADMKYITEKFPLVNNINKDVLFHILAFEKARKNVTQFIDKLNNVENKYYLMYVDLLEPGRVCKFPNIKNDFKIVKAGEKWPEMCGANWEYESNLSKDYILITPPNNGFDNILIKSIVEINEKISSYEEELSLKDGKWVSVGSKNIIDGVEDKK